MLNFKKNIYLLKFATGRKEVIFLAQNKYYRYLYWMAYAYRRVFLKRVQFVTIVGSLGKTTTTNSIKYLLGLKVKNSYESNSFGAIATRILRTNPFTNYRILEIGIGKKGDMEKYARLIQPDYVILTSINAEHIENFGTIEEIWKEKAKIFSSKKKPRLIIYNGDDENVEKMLNLTTSPKISYGLHPKNDFYASGVKMNFTNGLEMKIHHNNTQKSFKVSLFGEKMGYCFLASFALAKKLNIADELIDKRAKNISPSYGRMQMFELESGATLISDEFKASKESVMAAYRFLDTIKNRRKIIIQGTLSHVIKKQRQLYKEIGAEAGKRANFVFFISSSDHEQAMTANAKKAGIEEKNVFRSKGSWRWIGEKINQIAKENDIILIKGSRMQKLERLSLAIQGTNVKCIKNDCILKYTYCKDCSLLTK